MEDGDCNMIVGAPGSHCGEDIKLCIHPYVTVDETTESAEKPNIENEHQGLNSLRVPLVQFQSRDHTPFEYSQVTVPESNIDSLPVVVPAVEEKVLSRVTRRECYGRQRPWRYFCMSVARCS